MAHDLPIECYKFASQQSWIDGLTHRAWVLEQDWELQWGMSPTADGCIRRISTEKWTILGLGTLTWFFDLGGLYLVVITSLLYLGRFGFGIPDLQHGMSLQGWRHILANPKQLLKRRGPVYASLAQLAPAGKRMEGLQSNGVHLENHDAGMFVDVSTTQEPGSNHRSIAFRYNRVPKFWIPNRWTMTISNLFFGHLEPDDSNHPLSAFFWPRSPWSFLFRHVQIDEFSIKV